MNIKNVLTKKNEKTINSVATKKNKASKKKKKKVLKALLRFEIIQQAQVKEYH